MEKLYLINRVLILLALSLGTSCNVKAQLSIQPEADNPLALVSLQFDKWKNKEASFFELLADNIEWTVAGKSPVSGVYIGKTAFINYAVAPILAKLKTALKPELISLTADDKHVWLHFKASAHRIDNKRYENNYIWKMEVQGNKIIRCTAFLDTYALAELMDNKDKEMDKTMEESKAYIGMWVTADGYIRHELLPDNRYDEARGNRKKAYLGSYKVRGNHIDYKDDTGFTADGDFKDGILYHEGMILYKEKK